LGRSATAKKKIMYICVYIYIYIYNIALVGADRVCNAVSITVASVCHR